jgi:hypothetical protein
MLRCIRGISWRAPKEEEGALSMGTV